MKLLQPKNRSSIISAAHVEPSTDTVGAKVV